MGGWKVALAYLGRSWEAHERATKEVQELFTPLATGPTLVMNLLTYAPSLLRNLLRNLFQRNEIQMKFK